MKFLVDAQLPRRLALLLRDAGHDARHTLDLPHGNRSSDQEILAVAASEERVVITKDSDFVHSFLLEGRPEKLLLISTGNITNAELEALLIPLLPPIVQGFERSSFLEVNRSVLIIHD